MMPFYRGVIVENKQNGFYTVSVSQISEAAVEAQVCGIKGLTVIYEPGDIVFVSGLDHDYIILGFLQGQNVAGICQTDRLYASTGTLGENFTIGNVTGKEISKAVWDINRLVREVEQ